MNPISAFFVRNIILVFFFYGLAFFTLGLALALASRRASEFRFAQAIRPLALFGLLHGVHQWIEMFQKIAALTSGYAPTTFQELLRLAVLVLSLLMLAAFGLVLLNPVRGRGRSLFYFLLALTGLWLAGTLLAIGLLRPSAEQAVALADVMARYSLAIPGSLLGAWALMAQQRTFREHGMPQFGRDLVWAATALLLYGVVSELFARETALMPSAIISSTRFLQWFGIPVQLFRGVMAAILAFFMMRALNAFELEAQRRLETANEAKLQAQAEALEAERLSSRQMEQLNADLRQTARELSLMLALSNLLAEPMALQDQLRSALQRLVRSLDFPNASMVLLVNEEVGTVQVQAHCGFSRKAEEPKIQPQYDWAQELGMNCATKGLVTCRHLDGSILESTFEEARRNPKCQSYESPMTMLSLPLIVREKVIGSIVLVQTHPEKERIVTRDELELIVGVIQQLGLSIENARLYQEAQQRKQMLGNLLHQIVGAQEAERQRIARELHDATGQSLTAISLGLRGVEGLLQKGNGEQLPLIASQVGELKNFGANALGELRQIIADLRPSILDELGLAAALKWYVQAFESRRGIATDFVQEGEAVRLSSEYETVLFRITQEAMTNIAKHAQASRVTVMLRFTPAKVCLMVDDDGVGFDVKAQEQRNDRLSGWGLLGIQERTSLLGGSYAIDSTPGAGTTIWVTVPLIAQEREETHVQD